MLAHFPTLYKDELLYSGIARYHVSSGNRTQKQTIQDLFGDTLVCASVDLPSHLGTLAKRLNSSYSVEQLINDHTLFSYYSYFLKNEKRAQVITLMDQGASTGVVHAKLGLLAGLIKPPAFLRFCPSCRRDETILSEPYWHRSHQLPGVVFCEKHKDVLVESNVVYSTRNHKFAFIPLIQISQNQCKQIKVIPGWEKHLQYIKHCFETILKLWKHRSAFPSGSRPLENFEPILRALARLDPENDRHYFFEDRHITPENVTEEIQKWLNVAKGIDEAARVWLKYVFKQATLAATDESTIDWLENSAVLQESDHFSVIFRDLYSDVSEIWEDSEGLQQKNRNKIVSNIKKLEAFTELNQLLLTKYKQELEKFPTVE